MRPFGNYKQLFVIPALALVMAAIPPGLVNAADAPAPDCYLLSVGIDNYLYNCSLSGDVADAYNMTNAFAAQQAKMFGTVYASTLVDAQATRAPIVKQMQDFAHIGKAGDYFVVFLSGRAGAYSNDGSWFFSAYDEDSVNNDGDVSAADILKAADVLMKQGKKVVVIADASFAGRLGQAAEPYLNSYQDARGGGLIVAMSSSPMQPSYSLNCYSPFAQAFVDGLSGAADLNGDGTITLQELKNYSYSRTYDLLRQGGNCRLQDSQVLWSRSLSADSPLGLVNAP